MQSLLEHKKAKVDKSFWPHCCPQAQEAVAPKEGEDGEENGEEYAYPDATDLSRRDTVGHPFVPLALRRSGSVNIPLSTFEVCQYVSVCFYVLDNLNCD